MVPATPEEQQNGLQLERNHFRAIGSRSVWLGRSGIIRRTGYHQGVLIMFEVFAVTCFLSSFGYMNCDDAVIDSFDDPISCEIVANDRRKDHRYMLVQCIPSPEVEPMP